VWIPAFARRTYEDAVWIPAFARKTYEDAVWISAFARRTVDETLIKVSALNLLNFIVSTP
jgi:hypothetical protein